jgi:hypothetical protein
MFSPQSTGCHRAVRVGKSGGYIQPERRIGTDGVDPEWIAVRGDGAEPLMSSAPYRRGCRRAAEAALGLDRGRSHGRRRDAAALKGEGRGREGQG